MFLPCTPFDSFTHSRPSAILSFRATPQSFSFGTAATHCCPLRFTFHFALRTFHFGDSCGLFHLYGLVSAFLIFTVGFFKPGVGFLSSFSTFSTFSTFSGFCRFIHRLDPVIHFSFVVAASRSNHSPFRLVSFSSMLLLSFSARIPSKCKVVTSLEKF